MKLNGLEYYFETVNGEIVDFNQFNKFGHNPLSCVLQFNVSDNFNIDKFQLDYLLKKTNIKLLDSSDRSILMHVFKNNKSQNLNLSKDQFDYLIKNSDLKHVNIMNFSALKYVLIHKERENINLSNEQWKYIIENSNLSLIKNKEQLMKLKKIQSELLNEEILDKINIKKNINKKIKI